MRKTQTQAERGLRTPAAKVAEVAELALATFTRDELADQVERVAARLEALEDAGLSPADPGLTSQDASELRYVASLIESGDFEQALAVLEGLDDTACRDEIPPHVYAAIGGDLTSAGLDRALEFLHPYYQEQLESAAGHLRAALEGLGRHSIYALPERNLGKIDGATALVVFAIAAKVGEHYSFEADDLARLVEEVIQ